MHLLNIFVCSFWLESLFCQRLFLERNPKDTNALQCLGIIQEFNQRFIQAAHAYQL